MLTVKPLNSGNAQKIYSLTNIHGDTFVTSDTSGTNTGTAKYDPFGTVISSTTAANAPSGVSEGYLGGYKKSVNVNFILKPQEMGARTYIASMGRFLQVDPVEGGNANRYVYPEDPVNTNDISGLSAGPSFRKIDENKAKFNIHDFKADSALGSSKVDLYTMKGDATGQIYYGNRNAKQSTYQRTGVTEKEAEFTHPKFDRGNTRNSGSGRNSATPSRTQIPRPSSSRAVDVPDGDVEVEPQVRLPFRFTFFE